MAELTEAEMVGSTSLVRSLLDTLSSRARIPAKILIHHDDLRPGYFGTWTRSSRIIGPRTPLAKDALALDYGYDSGEEWEEDWNGDGEDVVEDGEEEDGDALEDVDSDLDDWLVDDDEVEEVMEKPREWTGSLPPEMPPPALKRKPNDASKEKSLGKKRKVVVPLMPFAKGPCWEREIGTCSYDPFRPYKIHLFNGRWPSRMSTLPCTNFPL
jgi:chromatin assembly factor 1 subunit A